LGDHQKVRRIIDLGGVGSWTQKSSDAGEWEEKDAMNRGGQKKKNKRLTEESHTAHGKKGKVHQVRQYQKKEKTNKKKRTNRRVKAEQPMEEKRRKKKGGGRKGSQKNRCP